MKEFSEAAGERPTAKVLRDIIHRSIKSLDQEDEATDPYQEVVQHIRSLESTAAAVADAMERIRSQAVTGDDSSHRYNELVDEMESLETLIESTRELKNKLGI